MARKTNTNRKRFFNASRSKFKRLFAAEKNKINVEIQKLLSQTSRTSTSENDSKFDNVTAEQTDQYHGALRDWALKYNIRTYCMRDLLKILRNIGVPFLPKEPATLLRTPKIVEVEHIGNGQFWYSGITNKLCRILQAADVGMEISLNFHFDGLQLFQNSSKQFWPILGQIHG